MEEILRKLQQLLFRQIAHLVVETDKAVATGGLARRSGGTPRSMHIGRHQSLSFTHGVSPVWRRSSIQRSSSARPGQERTFPWAGGGDQNSTIVNEVGACPSYLGSKTC